MRATTTKKAKPLDVFNADGSFSAERYCTALWQLLDGPYYSVCGPYTLARPLTLAEHERAEAEAHRQMEARIENGPDGVPCLDDNDGENDRADVQEIESFADNVLLDMRVWENVANDLLAFRRGGTFTIKKLGKAMRSAAGNRITHQVIERNGKDNSVVTYGTLGECFAVKWHMEALFAGNVVPLKRKAA